MTGKIKIDGAEYDIENLSQDAKKLLGLFRHANSQYQEAVNMKALLIRAKNSYLSELKSEMVQGKTGLDLSDLFSDD